MCHFAQIPTETAFKLGRVTFLKIAPVRMLIGWHQPPSQKKTVDGKEIKTSPPIEPQFAIYNAIHRHGLHVNISPDTRVTPVDYTDPFPRKAPIDGTIDGIIYADPALQRHRIKGG